MKSAEAAKWRQIVAPASRGTCAVTFRKDRFGCTFSVGATEKFRLREKSHVIMIFNASERILGFTFHSEAMLGSYPLHSLNERKGRGSGSSRGFSAATIFSTNDNADLEAEFEYIRGCRLDLYEADAGVYCADLPPKVSALVRHSQSELFKKPQSQPQQVKTRRRRRVNF